MTNEAEIECTICHIPKSKHSAPNILHEFCPPGQNAILAHRSQQSHDAHEGNAQGSNGVRRTSGGSDAILRMALLRKGIIEVADLEQIENELRVTGAVGYDPSSAGHS